MLKYGEGHATLTAQVCLSYAMDRRSAPTRCTHPISPTDYKDSGGGTYFAVTALSGITLMGMGSGSRALALSLYRTRMSTSSVKEGGDLTYREYRQPW